MLRVFRSSCVWHFYGSVAGMYDISRVGCKFGGFFIVVLIRRDPQISINDCAYV